jgi:dihydroorotate dehydrogenase (fumarate)
MTDLTTTYMGLTLKNPIVPSASPLTRKLDGIKQLEDAGAAAITMYSLFEEQIDIEALAQHDFLEQTVFMSAEATAYFPKAADYNRGPDGYLDLICDAKASVDIPVIGSLNGVTTGGWTRYARLIEEAGADALELNVYLIPTRTSLTSDGVENTYLEILREVKAQVKIPVALKLSPFFSALPNMAHRLDRAGADALVLFNRFYQPDFDLEELVVTPHLVLSTPWEMRLPLRWIALLYGHVAASLALTSGVHTAKDAVKAVMAGANIVNVCSALLEKGPGYIAELVQGFGDWMAAHEYESVDQMRGALSQRNVAEPAAFERANYMKVLGSWK